jgi:uncharacterized repeat protein (TIGR04076 family)
MIPEKGFRVLATVKKVKGTCNACHKLGDVVHLSARNPNGLCGYLYYAAFPYLLMLQFGGSFPWDDSGTVTVDCPDTTNRVTIELRRIKSES